LLVQDRLKLALKCCPVREQLGHRVLTESGNSGKLSTMLNGGNHLDETILEVENRLN
jgi:hypothetical protein